MTLSEATKILASVGIENAKAEARRLFEQIGGIPAHKLVGNDVDISSDELNSAIMRRSRREPLQYILGSVDFYRESYEVSPDCLIPRADTEVLVEYAIKHIPSGEFFLDLCTGSGCVAISTLKNTDGTRAAAYELSRTALEVARINAKKNRVEERLELIEADVLDKISVTEPPYAILSNPPYVSETDYSELAPEIAFEPKLAFTAGEDGGDFYRALVPRCKELIKPNGFFAFEIGYDQGELSRSLAEKHSLSVEILKDLSGNDRVAVFRLKE